MGDYTGLSLPANPTTGLLQCETEPLKARVELILPHHRPKPGAIRQAEGIYLVFENGRAGTDGK